MFVFGHMVTVADAGIFRSTDLMEGEGVLAIMFPDLLSCHSWAYDACWGLSAETRTHQMIKAHIIGDAVIHFGERWCVPNRKRGWAYRMMGLVARQYDEFFDRAAANGWLVDPADLRPDSRRGWAHTLIEYSVDQYLVDHRPALAGCFPRIRAEFERVTDHLGWVEDILHNVGVQTSKPFPEQPLRYAHIMAAATSPDEFHLRGLAAKFNLVPSDDVLDHLRRMLRDIISRAGRQELEHVVAMLTEVAADPAQFSYPIAPGDAPWVWSDLPGSP